MMSSRPKRLKLKFAGNYDEARTNSSNRPDGSRSSSPVENRRDGLSSPPATPRDRSRSPRHKSTNKRDADEYLGSDDGSFGPPSSPSFPERPPRPTRSYAAAIQSPRSMLQKNALPLTKKATPQKLPAQPPDLVTPLPPPLPTVLRDRDQRPIPDDDAVMYCLVQHPIASSTPLPHAAPATCYNCVKKILVPRQSVMSKAYGYLCIACGKQLTQARSWIDSVVTALLNLELNYGGQYFHHKDGICKFIDQNWDMCCGKRERTATWWKTVLATVTTRSEIFHSERCGSGNWALVERLVEEKFITPESQTPTKSHSTRKGETHENGASPLSANERQERKSDNGNSHNSRKDQKKDKKKTKSAGHFTSVPLTPELAPSTPVSAPPSASTSRPKASKQDSTLPALSTPVLLSESLPKANTVEAAIAANTKAWNHAVLNDRTCHHCKVVKSRVVSCDALVPATGKKCLFKFCNLCLERYNDQMEKISKAPSTWMCPSCRGECLCAQCKRARLMGTPASVRLPRQPNEPPPTPALKKNKSQTEVIDFTGKKLGDEDSLQALLDFIDNEAEDPLVDDDFEDSDEFDDDFDLLPGEDGDLTKRSLRPKANGAAATDSNRKKKKKKRPLQRKNVNDWDIGRIVYNGRPETCNIVRPPTCEIHLPKFRVVAEGVPASPRKAPPRSPRKAKAREEEIPDQSDGDSDEDLSEWAFSERHQRAASVMREQLFPGVDPARTRV